MRQQVSVDQYWSKVFTQQISSTRQGALFGRCKQILPGWVAEKLHGIAEITSRRSAENDTFLLIQVKRGAKTHQKHHYRYKPHGASTTFTPGPGRWGSTNDVHLFCCASLLSLISWSQTRIIRAVLYARQSACRSSIVPVSSRRSAVRFHRERRNMRAGQDRADGKGKEEENHAGVEFKYYNLGPKHKP